MLARVQWHGTVSAYLIGLSFGQLIWGPVGDRFGRRLPIAAGLVLFAIGSAGCALSGSAATLIAWRVVQALGACSGVVLARAMVRDLYAGDQAAKMLSTLMTVMAIAPLVGPLISGQMLVYVGWRSIFWLLVAVGLATLAALATLPETLPVGKRNNERLRYAFTRYAEILRNRRFLAYAFAGGFFYAGLFAYIAGTPFAYITFYHVPPQYFGLLFALGIIGIMGSNFINTKIVSRMGSTRLMILGMGGAAISGIVLAIDAHTGWGGLVGLVLPLFAFLSMCGFTIANSISGALTNFSKHAGAASALVGTIHYGSGIIGSALVGFFADGTPWPMGAVMAIAGIGSFLCARLVATKRTE